MGDRIAILRRFAFFAVAGLLVLILGLAETATAQDQNATFDKQVDMIRADWRHLKSIDESGRAYSAIQTKKAVKASAKKQDRTMADRVQSKPGYLIFNAMNEDKQESVVGRNPQYAFVIMKRNSASSWVLGSFQEGSDFSANKSLLVLRGTGIDRVYPLSVVFHVPGDEFFVRYQPTIVGIKHEGPNRLRLRYVRKLSPEQKKGGADISGELVLDPTRFHCVLEENHARGSITSHVKREIGEKAGELIVTKMVFTDPIREETITFEDYQFNRPVPERECYLSHYGLPEPLDVTAPAKPPTWWPYIFGACAAACLMGALYLWRQAVSRRAVDVSGAGSIPTS